MDNPDNQQVIEKAKAVGEQLNDSIDSLRSALKSLGDEQCFAFSAQELYNLLRGLVSYRALFLFQFVPDFTIPIE